MNEQATIWTSRDLITPEFLPVQINNALLEEVMDAAARRNTFVLAFVIGTKACFNKVYGAVQACLKTGQPFFIIDANQHHDQHLVFMRSEFGLDAYVGFNLQIRGDLIQKSGELLFKTDFVAQWLLNNWKNVSVIPVVIGDTLLCPMVSAGWMFSRSEKSIHYEAGLRSMAPVFFREISPPLSIDLFLLYQWFGEWELSLKEPFPEQWDTFSASAASDFYLVPQKINQKHLIREGYQEERIFEVGYVVRDALSEMQQRVYGVGSIFEQYPLLSFGQWIRVDVHRRENMTAERLDAIIGLMEHLVAHGYQVNFILMNSARLAFQKFNLIFRIDELQRTTGFLLSEVWEKYEYVVEFYQSTHFLCAITDSGGVQEEMYLLGKPCFTLRFSSDRPETVFEGHANLLVPPQNSAFMFKVVDTIITTSRYFDQMKHSVRSTKSSACELFVRVLDLLR